MLRLTSLLLLVPSFASAQVSLINGLGGPAGYGTNCLGPNDDGSSMEIDITPIFPTGIQFFDRVHTTMFVNTNGNVSFSEGLAAYTPDAFPIANQPMIAPYWADVDTRPQNGTCGGYPDGSGRPEYMYAGDCMDQPENAVWWHFDTANSRIIVTWDRVGYYRCHTGERMSFQLILTAAPGTTCGGGADFDVEFRFNECEWTTGDASGGQNGDPRPDTACVRQPGPGMRYVCPIGPIIPCDNVGGTRMCSAVPAQAGFDAGNTMDFVEIMGSRTAEIGNIMCTMSNVSMPGIWQFQIRSGVIECPDAGDPCPTGMMGACASGRTQCVGAGVECRPEVPASDERCDAVDNDCDGMTDEGTLCPSLQTCMAGTCVGSCFEGGCPVGEVCAADGNCVDEGCETITCPDTERCVDGACVAACDGVVCPVPLACRAGACVDLCEGAVCDECTACDGGDCVPRCQFVACPAGEACLADGTCIEAACENVTCAAGEYCAGGTCMDACAGAVCPTGTTCVLGECVPAGLVDAGPLPPIPDAGRTRDGGFPDAGSIAMTDAGMEPPVEEGGCGCRTASSSPAPLALFAIAIVAIVARKRR